MSASVTRAPHSASTSAIAKPSPAAAPVTMIRLPRTSKRRLSTSVGSVMPAILDSAMREPLFTETLQIALVVRDLESAMETYVSDYDAVYP